MKQSQQFSEKKMTEFIGPQVDFLTSALENIKQVAETPMKIWKLTSTYCCDICGGVGHGVAICPILRESKQWAQVLGLDQALVKAFETASKTRNNSTEAIQCKLLTKKVCRSPPRTYLNEKKKNHFDVMACKMKKRYNVKVTKKSIDNQSDSDSNSDQYQHQDSDSDQDQDYKLNLESNLGSNQESLSNQLLNLQGSHSDSHSDSPSNSSPDTESKSQSSLNLNSPSESEQEKELQDSNSNSY